MISTGQIIYFSDQQLMCFGVESIEDITDPEEQTEITTAYDDMRTYIPAIMKPTTLVVTGKEIVKLDPTTMKHIARYNLEEENKALLKEITERKKVVDDLEQKEQVLRDRFKKAISTFKGIMENGYYDEDEDEYESEWE